MDRDGRRGWRRRTCAPSTVTRSTRREQLLFQAVLTVGVQWSNSQDAAVDSCRGRLIRRTTPKPKALHSTTWHYKQDREKRPISFHSIEYFLGQILDFARLRIRPH